MQHNIINIQDIITIINLTDTAQMEIQRNDSPKEIYRWMEKILKVVRYTILRRKEKTAVLKYFTRYSGYERRQITRLVQEYRETGRIRVKKRTQPQFQVKYTTKDIVLLAEVAAAYAHQNGKALQRICQEMYTVYGDIRFIRLKDISVAHLYRLKKKEVFKTHARHFTKTKKTTVPIGERTKPLPNGKPGYIRVDSVHQGDKGKEKGVYHINLVDEVTQWQIVVCVEGISERFLIPALEKALSSFPFEIVNFHSDNGSEYINYTIAELLEKMRVSQTKGRARRCNDNAMVECKNGATIRKHIGHAHIPKQYATKIDDFYQDHFNDFLNYHRFCAFPEDILFPNGKIKKVYNEYKTPVQKLLFLPKVEQYLKEGITIAILRQRAQEKNHLQVAQAMQQAKTTLFT